MQKKNTKKWNKKLENKEEKMLREIYCHLFQIDNLPPIYATNKKYSYAIYNTLSWLRHPPVAG